MQPKRPDFYFITKNRPSRLYAPFIVELQVGEFDNNHKGKMATYNSMILETSVRRNFITSILTNLEEMIFVKSSRIAPLSDTFKHDFSDEKKFWLDDTSGLSGLNYIQQMLDTPEIVGYDEQLNFTISIKNPYVSINVLNGQFLKSFSKVFY